MQAENVSRTGLGARDSVRRSDGFTAALLQTGSLGNLDDDPVQIRKLMNDMLAGYVEKAAADNVNILGFQELCNQPYFCPLLDNKWFAAAELMDGPTISLMRDLAGAHSVALVVPIFEVEDDRNYNTAAVNRTGPDPVRADTFFAGDSYFADPRGEVIASTGSDEGLITALIDLEAVRQVRIEWSYFRDRRPESYGDLTNLLK